MNRGRLYLAAASVVIGVSSMALLLLAQMPRFAIRDFGFAITATGIVVLLLLGGIIMGSVAGGSSGAVGVILCGIGLAFWGLIALGELL